jgi:hypothetical protein
MYVKASYPPARFTSKTMLKIFKVVMEVGNWGSILMVRENALRIQRWRYPNHEHKYPGKSTERIVGFRGRAIGCGQRLKRAMALSIHSVATYIHLRYISTICYELKTTRYETTDANMKQTRANKGRGGAGERCDSNITSIIQQEYPLLFRLGTRPRLLLM